MLAAPFATSRLVRQALPSHTMPQLTTLLAEWAALNSGHDPVSPPGACRRAAPSLRGAVRRGAAVGARDSRRGCGSPASRPFADRVEGVYMPWDWFEQYSAGVRLPVAEIEGGWDISDGEEVYWCPRVMVADDPDSPQDTRAF